MRQLIAGLVVALLAGCSSASVSGGSVSSSSGTPSSSGGATSNGSSSSASASSSSGSTASASSSSGTTSSGSNGSTTSSSSTTSTGGNANPPYDWSYDGGDPCEPVPPQAVVDFTPPAVTRTVALSASDDLQQALDAAQPGDELVLPAGAVFTGNFELKPRSGSGWITVRSDGVASLPPLGQRIAPARDAQYMARIESNNSVAAITADTGAAYWRFVGIEVGIAAGTSLNYNLVLLGDATQTAESDLPHDLVIDRCWIHGNDTGDARRGIALNADSVGVIGSDVDDFHEVGADSQALGGWNGGGPFTLVNNYLEGAAETVLFGGSDPRVPNLVPSDIVLWHNTLTKRLSWKSDDPSYDGVNNVVKNTLELKNARRVWIEGNTIEHSWPMGQVGYAIVLTPRNQDGTAPWSTLEDVTLVRNLVREAAGGTNIQNSDNDQPSQTSKRVRVWDNLFLDVGYTDFGTSTKIFQFLNGGQTGSCWSWQHLTADNGTTFGAIGDTATVVDQFVFANNIVAHGSYGFFGSAVGEGNAALNTYTTNWTFAGNVIYGGGSASQYPSGNAFAADPSAVGFADPASGDWALSASSSYAGTGTDGRDPGADVNAVMAAVQ